MDIIFSMIQKQKNLKPNPYLVDTTRHLITIALGEAPGFSPACDANSLPLTELTKAFVESYSMNKYYAHIMQPTTFTFETAKHPVYYSLQYPSSFGFSPKARKVFSTLFEMRELSHIVKIFMNELGQSNGVCQDTVLKDMANSVTFDYFHNACDPHKVIQSSSALTTFDQRFAGLQKEKKQTYTKFAADSPFVRGCIGIHARQ